MTKTGFGTRLLGFGVATLALAACDTIGSFDPDLRGGAGQFDTSDAARNAVLSAPQPDARGVVTYPDYQVVIARRGDTVGTIAARLGVSAETLSSFNAIPQNVALREGEIIALPAALGAPGSGTLDGTGTFDVATIAGTAIDRAEGAPATQTGQPTRHLVSPGETAFSIARLYDVPVAALAEWNGLGADLALREGQYLLIPVKAPQSAVEVAAIAPVEAPGAGSTAPTPPSAAAPLPTEDATPAPTTRPEPTDLSSEQTAASDTSRLRMPVQGRIVRPYEKGVSEGIGISAAVGTPVAAADDGTVAAITRDTDQVPILVLRHEGSLLTVYAGVQNITVEKGDSVVRGQKIAEVRDASPSFLHFEVREGFDSVDPIPYLN
ncbi:MAG: peptidoglycan DD-metalloendopeptidase family protein [Boseongicola sp.]|nr:peptidoglycan DD-metalloendopeptidase family protein [Boseongicola sp.]